MELNDTYTQLWVLWLLAFGVIEGAAIARKDKGDTLSEHVWSWFKVKSKGHLARRGFLFLFMGWLLVHFVTGGEV